MYIVFNKENNKEDLKFKVSDYVKNQNIKIFLQKAIF